MVVVDWRIIGSVSVVGGKTAASARNTGDGFISPAVGMTTAPVDGRLLLNCSICSIFQS